jgi:uncharacterized protein YndB with AHSA1/START domain
MATVRIVRSIQAPAAVVFRAVADPQLFAQAIGGVTRLEFLSAVRSGVGTRFRQTRRMDGRESTMEFEITEHVGNERVRIVNETHGTTWDSVFTVAPAGSSATLSMVMTTRSRRLLPRLLMPLICLVIRKAVARDIDAVKALCEARP